MHLIEFASILFPRSWIIFSIIILNFFSGRLPISTSFSCFSGVLSCSFIWYKVLCLLILSIFLWMWFSFHRLQNYSSSCFCCLPSGGWSYLRGLRKLPDGRDWWWVELSKTLIRLSADVWGWIPSLLVVWPAATQHWSLRGSLVGLMADSGRSHTRIVGLSYKFQHTYWNLVCAIIENYTKQR